MLKWRFDQGRLDYFQFDEIKKIAATLAAVDGMEKPLSPKPDVLRLTLGKYSSLPFAPSKYYVWRNYSRVFGCQLLAAEVGNKILVTSLCKKLAAEPDDLDVDDYLAHVAKNFYYPSPIFEGYSSKGVQIFPIVAIVKFLISEFLTKNKSHVSLEEIVAYLIGNQVTGLESVKDYADLPKSGYSLSGDEPRQLRELLRFASQFSFLKWKNPRVFLEISSKAEAHDIENVLRPTLNKRESDAGREILQMGSGFRTTLGTVTIKMVEPIDQEFTEGKKNRVTHLRTERSEQLRKLFFGETASPEICNMCTMNTPKQYPWTPHVIELHHLLPLSSPIRVEKGTSSVKDLVGLCPTCHRATHKYYSGWLKGKGLKDFRNYSEAKAIYGEAKAKIVLA